MTGRKTRLSMSVTRMSEELLDIEVIQLHRVLAAVSDGLQEGDVTVITGACYEIQASCALVKAEFVEVEDIELDLVAIRRVAQCGRHVAFDERFRARENDLRRVKAGRRPARITHLHGAGQEKAPSAPQAPGAESIFGACEAIA